MGIVYTTPSGGGVSSSEVTATAADILKGKKTITSDSNDEVIEGTYEALDTSDATAVAEHLLYGETAYVNKKKITGTMRVNSAYSFKAAAIAWNKVRISWMHNKKGPYTGVKIRVSDSSAPGNSGGTLVGETPGRNDSGNNFLTDINGLEENKKYYFSVWSFCDGLPDSTYITNLNATTPYEPVDIPTFLKYFNGKPFTFSCAYGINAYNKSGNGGVDSFYSVLNESEKDKAAVYATDDATAKVWRLTTTRDSNHPIVKGDPYTETSTSTSYKYLPKLNLKTTQIFLQMDRWLTANSSTLDLTDKNLNINRIRSAFVNKCGIQILSNTGAVIKDFGKITGISDYVTLVGQGYYSKWSCMGLKITLSNYLSINEYNNINPYAIQFYAIES